MGITAVEVTVVLVGIEEFCALGGSVYTPVLDWAHARDSRRDGDPAGPARRLHGHGRTASARHHHRRAPAHSGATHGAPAGHAAPGAGHGDRRWAPAGRAGRRLLPA